VDSIRTAVLVGGLALIPAASASAMEFYFATDVGVSLLPNIRIKDITPTATSFGLSDVDIETDPGLAWTASFGAKLTEMIGLEVQSGYVYNSLGSIGGGEFTSSLGNAAAQGGDGELQQVPILCNVLFDIPLTKKESGVGELKLQVGGGVGVVYVDSSFSGVTAAGIPGVEASIDGDDWTFGYQGTVALRWGLTPNMDLGIRYRFMGTTEANFGPASFNTPLLVGVADVKAEAVFTNAIQASLEIRF
jgi:opacity protein-like surface antigen